jgi:hypothetical protein
VICSLERGKIREWLDRGVANAQWRNLFPNAVLVNEEILKSDHQPMRYHRSARCIARPSKS